MSKSTIRITIGTLALAYVLTHFFVQAHAQSSLGIGSNEATVPSTGFFAGLLNWINVQQQQFYRALTGALKSMRDGGGGTWLLVGLSFAYGVFHAAGPGHGKAVISSYMLANEVALRRGVMLSFVSALLQAVSAIVMIALAYLVLRGTAVSMTDATRFLEIASYVLITAFGAWLVWRKAIPRLRGATLGSPVQSLSSAGVAAAPSQPQRIQPQACAHSRLKYRSPAERASSPAEDVCADCGHAHMADPALLAGDRFSWKSAWAAVVAVGIRPCTGALIVLTFALLNGLYLGGLLSVLAMSFGTAITVAVLATIAVTAKNWAVLLAGDGRSGNAVHATIEIGGAAMVFALGLLLLTASIGGGAG